MKNIQGTGVALVTPFNADKSIDFPSLKKLIHHLISGKVDFIVAMGTTAETPTLSTEEKNKIVRFVVDETKGRLPVVLGIGGNNTEQVIETIKNTNFKGISAILSVVPYYNKPSQNGLYEHYSAIAKKSKLPIILYNVPGRTGVNMTADTTLKLAHAHKNIIAIKEASANFDQIMHIVNNKPKHFEVLSGDDGITLPLISIGMKGVISVTANSVPSDFSNMVRLALKGDFEKARKIHYKILELTHLFFAEGNPTGAKCTLAIQGIVKNHLRLPLVPASKDLEAKIGKWLSNNK